MNYLRNLNHKNIGIINGPLRLESARIRYQAWRTAIEKSGAEISDSCIGEVIEWSAEGAYKAMEIMLNNVPDLTAVFCANDLLAIGALSALSNKGYRVPEDFSVIGVR